MQKKSARDIARGDVNEEKNTGKEALDNTVFKEISPLDETRYLEGGKNLSNPESVEIQKAKKRIEGSDLDDTLKMQATLQAKNIKDLDDEKKVKKLIELAKLKGVVFAVNVAKKMDNPYILDMLHDLLAKKGYYQDFIK